MVRFSIPAAIPALLTNSIKNPETQNRNFAQVHAEGFTEEFRFLGRRERRTFWPKPR